jgi:hypothetical protein
MLLPLPPKRQIYRLCAVAETVGRVGRPIVERLAILALLVSFEPRDAKGRALNVEVADREKDAHSLDAVQRVHLRADRDIPPQVEADFVAGPP